MALKKPTIFITMSMSFAVRNFFETGIIDKLGETYSVVVLATPKIAQAIRQAGYGDRMELIELNVGPEPLLWRVIRQFKKKAYMEGRQSSTEAILEKYFPRPLTKKVGGWIAKKFVSAFDPVRLYYFLDGLEMRITTDRSLAQLFQERRPAFVFFTHVTHHHEEIIFRNCLAHGVRTLYMILSWDHLSAKVSLHARFDRILVWNEYTREETLRTYPRFKPEQVAVVGIPQYDLYAQKPSRSYKTWCEHYGLDPAKKTILFSTMPQTRHEQQHILIGELLREMVKGERVPPGYQLLIKCHPFDAFPSYGELVRGFPAAVHQTNFPSGQNQENWQPTSSEIEASRDALYFCAMDINIFSTVTIEAAYFDKPIIHIAFDPEPPRNRVPCHEYYNWDHFKHIVQRGGTILVKSFDELYAAIRQYHDDPTIKKAERALLVRTYIGADVGSASDHVVEELVRFNDAKPTEHAVA
jgi:hypothetical protein